MRHSSKIVCGSALGLVIAFTWGPIALGYVGPGAGGNGQSSGLGVATILVLLVAGALGLAVLCGLIAAGIAVNDRIRIWLVSRSKVESSETEKVIY